MLFSTETYSIMRKLGIEQGIKTLMDAGFPALDMSFFLSLSEFYNEPNPVELAKKLRAEADARGVIFNQAHAPFNPKDTALENCSTHFPRVFEFASILGVKNIVVHPIETQSYREDPQKALEINMKYYRSIAPLARENGLHIAIENMWSRHPRQKNLIVDSTCADPAELCLYYDTLNDPDVFTICLDLGHVALCGREPKDAIHTIGSKRLGAIHAHDVDYLSDMHTLPGLSHLDYDAIARALAEIDYQGDFTLESDTFLGGFPDEVLPDAARLMAATARHWAQKVEAYKKELLEKEQPI